MLLFLDIDGVMVPAKGWQAPELLEDGFPAFSQKAVGALRRLLTEDCTVILTTSHKSGYSIAGWKQLFWNRGLKIDRLDCLPPNGQRWDRRTEIVSWFEQNPVGEPFVIIDDDRCLNALPDRIRAFLIQPSPYVGLTERDADAAVALLGLG